jgi:heterodisulfide reductase subunit D
MFNNTGASILLTICSGCYKTINENYRGVGKLKPKVMHITEFLDEKLKEGKLKFQGKMDVSVTYHDPCHLGRHSGIFDAPRHLINAIPGMKLIEMERIRENSRCCGSGGGVKAGFPHIQQAISLDRAKEAIRTGARYLVTSCPFCYQSLKDALNKTTTQMEMKDVTQLLNEVMA